MMHETHDALQGVDLNLVVALDALLAERHVTRAAARLGITQSAASHALARLRDLLGDPILVRGPRGGMMPTPRAEELAPQIHRVLVDLAGVLRGATWDPATMRRTFRIGASDYVELVLLPRLIERISRLAPGVELWVHAFADHGDEELAAGTLDVVIGPPRGSARPAASYEKVLFDESFTCILRAGHPLADSRMTLARYCSVPHLLIAPRGTPGSFVDDALAELGKTRRVALAVPHFLVVPYIIAGSDLVATIATRVAARFSEALGLVTMPPPVQIPKFQIALAWHERNHRDAPQRWLREQLLAVAAEVS
ncbi:MAG: LysR family transcriptional regulator [Myxococcales bacterium]|nr:LysR family transcriptional regulator [Myxococcales bacterium]